jgi:hypothetical protein
MSELWREPSALLARRRLNYTVGGPARRSFSIGGSFEPSAFSFEPSALSGRRRLSYTVGGPARRSFSVGGSFQLQTFRSTCIRKWLTFLGSRQFSIINPSTLPGLKPGVCSGLILSGALHPVLKDGVWRRRSIKCDTDPVNIKP